MKIVIDTNIIFSALLNPKSKISEIVFDFNHNLQFFAPEYCIFEINKYKDKILKYSKLSDEEVEKLKFSILKIVNFYPQYLINEINWEKAHLILKNVDEDDIPFLALSLELNCKIWTGDKAFIKCLNSFEPSNYISTNNISDLISN
jgi:predicted nucleic acid-binding protein